MFYKELVRSSQALTIESAGGIVVLERDQGNIASAHVFHAFLTPILHGRNGNHQVQRYIRVY